MIPVEILITKLSFIEHCLEWFLFGVFFGWVITMSWLYAGPQTLEEEEEEHEQ